MNRLLLAGCGLALTVAATAAAQSAVLVVRSSGPSAKAYPAGKALGDNQSLTLRTNDVIVLLDSRGTRTLRGPGTFSASVSSGGTTSAAAALGQTSSRRSRIGAVRGAPTGATAGRNVWQADVSRSGNVCVVNPADAGLYRPKADVAGTVSIVEAGTSRSAQVEFAAGQRNAAWPEAMPITPGRRYEVRGAGSPVTLTAKSIAPVPSGMEGLAQSLIVNGCQAQLDVLIDTFSPNG